MIPMAGANEQGTDVPRPKMERAQRAAGPFEAVFVEKTIAG
jgi:hypothetical protein